MSSELVPVASFGDPASAEIAAARLRTAGIAARVHTDDAGGAYPQLQRTAGVKLLVAAADAGRARVVLADAPPLPEVVDSELETRRAELSVRGARSAAGPVVIAFALGLVLGLVVGALLARVPPPA